MRECRKCVAGSGKVKLFYEPREDIGEHPAQNWAADKLKRKKIVKRAQATEDRIARAIVRGTIRSGAFLGDGDHLILGEIRQEVKSRGVRKSWNVTLEEHDKGLKQGVEVWAIEIQRPDNNQHETLYCCTESLFSTLLAAYQEAKNKSTNTESSTNG